MHLSGVLVQLVEHSSLPPGKLLTYEYLSYVVVQLRENLRGLIEVCLPFRKMASQVI